MTQMWMEDAGEANQTIILICTLMTQTSSHIKHSVCFLKLLVISLWFGVFYSILFDLRPARPATSSCSEIEVAISFTAELVYQLSEMQKHFR